MQLYKMKWWAEIDVSHSKHQNLWRKLLSCIICA